MRNDLYMLPDNGQIACLNHLPFYGIRGGRDSSGARIRKLEKPELERIRGALGTIPDCETCRADAREAAR